MNSLISRHRFLVIATTNMRKFCDMKRLSWGGISLSPLLLLLAVGAHAGTPSTTIKAENTDDEVIAHVPSSKDLETTLLKSMQRYMRRHPDDLGTAIDLAGRYILKGKRESDTRYLGYAAALLKKWLDMENTPTEVTLLDAEIKQYNHDFSGALKSLSKISSATQHYPTAALMAANIHQIQGRFKAASAACEALGTRMSHISEICALSLASLTGNLEVARNNLRELVTANSYQPEIATWALGKLVDMSVRSGRVQEAFYYAGFMDERLAKAAFHRAQFADVLFLVNRPKDVLELISEEDQSDALIIRRLRAKKSLNQEWRSEQSERLERMFSVLSKRGKNPHAREAAYYYLYLAELPQKALAAALENWSEQKEPIDTRLLLEAAKQSNNLDAADHVVAWIIENRYQDVTLAEFLMPKATVGQAQ